MSEDEIDKMKQKVNCNEDSDCNECPYKMGDECLLDLYQKEKEENKKLRHCHLIYEEMTGVDLLLGEKHHKKIEE